MTSQGSPTTNSVVGSTSTLGRATTSASNEKQGMEIQEAEAAPQQTEVEEGQTSIPSIRKDKSNQGSSNRKRSRVHGDIGPTFVREGFSERESQVQKNKFDEFLQQLYAQIEAIFSKGERGKTLTNKLQVYETIRLMGMEVFQLIMSMLNLQDEKAALQHQVIQLMSQSANNNFPSLRETGTPATNTYLQAAMTTNVSNNIQMGKKLPLPDIPNSLQHSPSERVLIFKAEAKGVQLTKAQKEAFREDVSNVIGQELMNEVDVIRPTRNGGHTIIFHSEQSRTKALEAFRHNEKAGNIVEERSCIVAPKKKFAKVVCRDPPEDVTMDAVLNDFYGKNNIHLHQIPRMKREARIIDTRFGWIFEMSSIEAAAIQAQGGRIRYGLAKELRVEEYIPLQQCYRCCIFGHNAKDCYSSDEYCRLCGKIGHMGWDCPDKDNKLNWRCANCIISNESKGLNLPITHAAAQLHKCPCAQNQKEIRKAQLAAAGIFTSPVSEVNLKILTEPINTSSQLRQNGAQSLVKEAQQKTKKINRSRSRNMRREMQEGAKHYGQVSHQSSSTSVTDFHATPLRTFTSTTSSSSSSSYQERNNNNAGNENTHQQHRMMRVPRPRSYDGWKIVGAPRESIQSDEQRGRNHDYSMGTNSISNLPMPASPDIMMPSSTPLHAHDG